MEFYHVLQGWLVLLSRHSCSVAFFHFDTRHLPKPKLAGISCLQVLVQVQTVDRYEHYFNVNVFVFPRYVHLTTLASWSMETVTLLGALTAILPVTPEGTATS